MARSPAENDGKNVPLSIGASEAKAVVLTAGSDGDAGQVRSIRL